MPGNPYYKSPHWRALREACRRRANGKCEVPGCRAPGIIADHIVPRPPVPHATSADALPNLRWLCRLHDNQVKESGPGGRARRSGGAFKVRGSDASGAPLDMDHHWHDPR